MAIVDADAAQRYGWTAVDLARAFLAGGARLLQLRAKAAPSGWLFDTASAIVPHARAAGAVVIINDRADVALLCGADGVHIGQEDLAAPAVRRIAGNQAIVGLSTHTASQAEAAVREPVTYIATGPVFATATKHSAHEPIGLDGVRAAAQRTGQARRPLVAIGGITMDTAAGVIAAGAASVAVIGDLLADGRPEARVRAYLQRLTL
jgi:thiamine-phosphate pyrophosphorylase